MATIGGRASVEIDAPIEVVWTLVEDVLIAPEWQGGLDRMTALESDEQGRALVVETENDLKVRLVKARVRFAYDGPTRLSWEQVKGDLKSVHGAWELEDLGGGRTRASYVLDIDPGRMLTLVLRPIEPAVRAVFINGRPGELKQRIEAS